MAMFMLATVQPPDAPPAQKWVGVAVSLTSWDGTTWDLNDPMSGQVLIQEEVRGLDMPPIQHYRSEAASLPGSRWRDWRAQDREVFLPTLVATSEGSQEWVRLDGAIAKALHPGKLSTLTVAAPADPDDPRSGPRTLQIRYVEREGADTRDPALRGWKVYGTRYLTDWPFWQGQTVERSWMDDNDNKDWVNPGGTDVFWFTSSYTVTDATAYNPGDVEAYPTWQLDGPFSSATVGVGSTQVAIPFAVPAGESLFVDTRTRSVVSSTGERRTKDVTAAGWAPIPPGDEVPLNLTITKGGRVTMRLTPNYFRAWG